MRSQHVSMFLRVATTISTFLLLVGSGVKGDPEVYPEPNATNYPTKLPRESGFVGKPILDRMNKDFQIGAGGDLSLSIPLLTVPGKLPVDLNLQYKSGITLDQTASWVGLGWQLGGWSVKRQTVHGDDFRARKENWSTAMPDSTWFKGQTRYFVNDRYVVSIPGRTITFYNKGTMESPVFVPVEHCLDSLHVEVDQYYSFVGNQNDLWGWWNYRRYKHFVLTDGYGTRYIFGTPTGILKQTPIPDPRKDLHQEFRTQYSKLGREQTEWLLVAILSHDFRPGGNNALFPLQDSSQQTANNKGWWVAFKYTDGVSEDQPRMLGQHEYNCEDIPAIGMFWDTTDVVYLHRIITPTTVAIFNTVELQDDFQTPRYYRSGFGSTGVIPRRKDIVVSQLKLYENVDTIGFKKTNELLAVSFDYYDPQKQPLKTRYHQWLALAESGCPSDVDGEPTLRGLVFGTGLSYDYTNLEPVGVGGQRRVYRFGYDDLLDAPGNSTFANNIDNVRYSNYTNWSVGCENTRTPSDRTFQYQMTDDNFWSQSWLHSTGLVQNAWGRRDFWGYDYEFPWAWSLNTLTLPDGATFAFQYESDKYDLSPERNLRMPWQSPLIWSGGGCRVRQIVSNSVPNFPISDRNMSDTVTFDYRGDYGNDYGYAGSMPGVFWSYERLSEDRDWLPNSQCYSWGRYLRFLTDYISHEIIYPQIRWNLSGNRGKVDYYYSAPYPTYNQCYCPIKTFKDELYTCVSQEYADPLAPSSHYRYEWGIWLDRSPMHGKLWRTDMIDDSGGIVSSNQKFYSFVVNDAVLFNNDSLRYPDNYWPTYSQQGYYHTFSQTHDTLAISYWPQIDSELTVTDGVAHWSRNEYEFDEWRRLATAKTECLEEEDRTDYFYFSSPGSDYPSGSPMTPRRGGTYRGWIAGYSRYQQDSLGQNTRIQDQLRYFVWDTLNGHNWTYPAGTSDQYNSGGKELLYGAGDSRRELVLKFDENGNPRLTFGSDSTYSLSYWNNWGVEATFSNIFRENPNIAYCDGENESTDQPHPIVLSVAGERTGTDAFTGNFSLKRKYQSADTVVASLVLGGLQADSVPSGWYQVDGWVKAPTASSAKFYFKRQLAANVESTAVATNTITGQWQHISARMRLEGASRHLNLLIVAADTACRIDDIRVAPVASMVQTLTYDRLGRPASVSDNNNVPTRTSYDPMGGVRTVATYDWSPVSGQEYFFKAGENLSGNSPGAYHVDMPNVQYAISPRKKGVVEDFSRAISGRFPVTNPNFLGQNDRITFASQLDGQRYADLLIPVPAFDNGIVAFDVWDSSLFGTGPSDGAGMNCSNLWYGVENAAGQGYAVAFSREIGQPRKLHIIRYTGGSQYVVDSTLNELTLTGSRSDYASTNRGSKRLMLAAMGKFLYVFFDGDCIFRAMDRPDGLKFSNFDFVRFRFKSPQLSNVKFDSLWVDNLVVYNDPVVTATFLDASGQAKQTQVMCGDSLLISGSTYTSDGLPEAQFKPVAVAQSVLYGSVAGINSGVSAFEFVSQYLESEAIAEWHPGDSLATSALVRAFYSTTTDAPRCTTSTGRCAPYAAASYQSNPLRRVASATPEGEFGAHPSTVNYIPFSSSFSTEIAADENGHRSATFQDQKGRTIATVADSASTGIKATTQFAYDFDDHVGLITQPNGNKIRMSYNNFGQLIWDSSGDGGQSRLIYDVEGNLRFTRSAADSALGRFRFQKYDSLDRVTQAGYVPEYSHDTSRFTYQFVRQTAWPSADSVSGCVVLKEMHYDNGEFGKGRLSKVLTYHNGKASAPVSYDSLEYDFKGRVTAQIRTFYNLDNVNSYRKSIGAEYNNQDQLTKLTYPNGMIVSYRYDLAGRLAGVDDALGRAIATYAYWPDGKVKSKTLCNRGTPVQTVDYKYNARGWLTDINTVDGVTTSGTGSGDHYCVQLRYDNGGVNDGGWYNGNIAKYTAKVSPTGTYWSLTQKFDYDGLDRLTTDSCFGGYPSYGMTSIAYDLNGNVDSVMKPGMVYDYQYYPQSNRVKQVTNLYAGTDNFRYTPSGSMDSIKNQSLGVRYDSDERMIRRTRPGVLSTIDTVNYWYDEAGHRIGKEYRYHYTVQCNDSLPIEMAMGGGGEQMLEGQGDFQTDSGLIVDTLDGGFPGGGESIINGPIQNCSAVAGTLTGYYYFGDDLVAEYTGTPFTGGVLSSNYIYANGERIGRFTNANDMQYYLTDHLGSVLATIDQSGTVLNKTLYRPYGEIHAEAISNNDRHKYTGHERDEELGSQWDYFGQRYYIPNGKIFTQTDPVRDPSRTPYGYCAGNPMSNIDPDGAVVETVVDIASVGLSAKDMWDNPSWGNAGWLALDIVGAAVPFLPAVGAVRHGAQLLGKVDDVADAAKGVDKAVDAGKALDKTSHVAKVGTPGAKFSQSTKNSVLSANEAQNGGVLKSAESGQELVKAQKSQKGVRPPDNEAHVDHKIPRSKGGTNSPENAQVLSRKENLAKGNKLPEEQK